MNEFVQKWLKFRMTGIHTGKKKKNKKFATTVMNSVHENMKKGEPQNDKKEQKQKPETTNM